MKITIKERIIYTLSTIAYFVALFAMAKSWFNPWVMLAFGIAGFIAGFITMVVGTRKDKPLITQLGAIIVAIGGIPMLISTLILSGVLV